MITVPTKRKYRPIFKAGLRDTYQHVPVDSTLMLLEKAEPVVETFGGMTSMDKITDALDEFSRLFKAGVASDAEILTLARAFPENPAYTSAAVQIPDEAVMVVGGPASVELIDREGHLITTGALRNAFVKYMDNFRTRNAMVLHSDVQVGWALPAYITTGGQIYKSDVGDKGLFFICEIRNDTKISERVRDQIKNGKLKSYSIAGSATKVQNMTKGLLPYMQVDEMELAEVTVCEKGVNQGASFELLKAEKIEQTGKISKDQCGYREATPVELEMGISCGSCVYFNKQDSSCDTVVGEINENDYCIVYKPENSSPDTMETEEKEGISIEIHLSKQSDGSVNFTQTFLNSLKKEMNPFKDVKAAQFLGEHPPGYQKITPRQPSGDQLSNKPRITGMNTKVGGGEGTWADSQVGKLKYYMQQHQPEDMGELDWDQIREDIDTGNHPSFESWLADRDKPGADLSGIEFIEDEKEKYEAEDKHLDDALAEADRREAMFDEEDVTEEQLREQWEREFGEGGEYKKTISKVFYGWMRKEKEKDKDGLTDEEIEQLIIDDMTDPNAPQIPYGNIPEPNRPDIDAFEDAFEDKDEYNKLERFIKAVNPPTGTTATALTGTGGPTEDRSKLRISPNNLSVQLEPADPADPEEDPAFFAGALEKFVAESQKQWTLEDEPPSFNWGPYGLQSKSNIGV